MPRSQVEILIESIANLHIQLSSSLARESELMEVNQKLADALRDAEVIRELIVEERYDSLEKELQ